MCNIYKNCMNFFCLCSMLFLSGSFQTLLSSEYDQFPEWNIPLSQLEAEAAFLAANDEREVSKFKYELERRLQRDPEITCLTRLDAKRPEFINMVGHHPPYDFNRLVPKENPDIYLNASVVHTPEQEFILAGCPVLPEQAAELFMYMLEGEARNRVWVSLLDSSEKPEFCNNFWRPDFVKNFSLRHGWKLVADSTEVLAVGLPPSPIAANTTLVKTTLHFSNGLEEKTIYHLHYTGWFDRCVCPDGELFLGLLEKMHVLNKQPEGGLSSSKVPVGINCIGGVGRTGMVAVGYIAFLKMLDCPNDALAAMTLNIPEIIYSLRKQRARVAENSKHIISLHSFLGMQYKKIQAGM